MLTIHKPNNGGRSGATPGRWFQRSLASAIACLALVVVGCGGDGIALKDERDETAFRRGESLLREGRKAEALNAFLRVTENRREAPESHLNAGRLYLDHIRDPVPAIYHFRKYLELHPESDRAEHVRQLIETAEKQFVRHLPGQPGEDYVDRVDLMVRLEQAQEENLELKHRLAAANREIADVRRELERTRTAEADESRVAGTTAPAQRGRESPGSREAVDTRQNSERPRTYTVQPGDTLTRISREIYGTPGRWEEIFEANRDQLAGPHALRVGQELWIP